MSKYDSIKTAADMIAEIHVHGLSTNQDDLNRVADIFGNDSIEELDRLANDIGRNDENGNPDPNGSWSSDRIPTQQMFYSTLFYIWSWEEATRFWNLHTNPEHKELVELSKQTEDLKASLKYANELLKEQHQQLLDERAKNAELEGNVRRLGADLHDEKMTTMELKAKLYDLMVSREARA